MNSYASLLRYKCCNQAYKSKFLSFIYCRLKTKKHQKKTRKVPRLTCIAHLSTRQVNPGCSLKDKPEFIYNADEKGINTGGGKTTKYRYFLQGQKSQVITSERAQTVTVYLGPLFHHILFFPVRECYQIYWKEQLQHVMGL